MTQIRNRRPPTPKAAAACCGPLDDLLKPDLFKALGDPTPLALLSCIAKCGRGCSVSEIAECCSVDLSVVSRHLSMLARAGALEVERKGRMVLYKARYAELCGTLRTLADALAQCSPEHGASITGACCAKR